MGRDDGAQGSSAKEYAETAREATLRIHRGEAAYLILAVLEYLALTLTVPLDSAPSSPHHQDLVPISFLLDLSFTRQVPRRLANSS